MNRIKFYHNGNLLEGKVVERNMEARTITVYVEDHSGAYHMIIFDTQVAGSASQEEQVSKPARYNKAGTLECWDVILDQKMDFLEGSVLKYLWRHKEKNGSHDLKKAIEYLNKMVKDYDKLYKK